MLLAIHGAGRCSTMNNPRPPPIPLPPRLPAWYQPEARPFISLGVLYARRLSTPMPRVVLARFVNNTTSTAPSTRLWSPGKSPSPQSRRRRVFRQDVPSFLGHCGIDDGAQQNFHIWGESPSATSAVIWVTDAPACLS